MWQVQFPISWQEGWWASNWLAGFWSISRIPIDQMTPQVPGCGTFPCHLGYFHSIKLGMLPPIKYSLGGCLSVGNIFAPLIILLPAVFLGAPSYQLFLIGCPTMRNALPGYFPFQVPILATCDPSLIYPLYVCTYLKPIYFICKMCCPKKCK